VKVTLIVATLATAAVGVAIGYYGAMAFASRVG
jgi:hypothetical protein